ncbi:hypothetical protein T069G_00343 [Trichoderma breve]|uniref:2Fe-2S ferredoxin-type domain-containing protein n=1 Tax=Trichoderma breve TaxID=2034170 RepID=A0A9W9EBT3_9HYPO|nr:hypothetical protein T069G_00343 [Trichoderma breve]KAJ4863813.1 hypothetical protein T069G_00343 [Trichoderma breve]
MSASRSLSRSLARLSQAGCRRAPSTNAPYRGLTALPSPILRSAPTSRALQSLQLSPSRRAFSTTPQRRHGHVTPPKPGEELWVTFIDKEGEEHKFAVSAGDNLLDIAQANDLEMEEGEDHFDKMPEPEDDENDMLDLAFGLTETSRLGCQVIMTKELDGLVVRLPSMTRNMQASDFQ